MLTDADNSTGAKAGTRQWLGLLVLALPTLLLAVDISVLHLALPHLAADLAPTSTQQLWILDIYGFMIAGFLVTMGTLGDRIGRRRLLMIGATAFGAASVAAAYSVSPEMLILTRALLGLAGATLMPSTMALLSNMFHNPKQRAFAIAVWLSCFSGGMALGPVIGGFMLEWFWWGSVFLMGVPVMGILLILGPFLLPEYRDPNPGRMDLVSVALSLTTLLPFVYAFKEAAKDGWGATESIALLIALVSGWFFLRRQNRLASPLMDLKLFRYRAFSVGLLGLLISSMFMGGFMLIFAQYLQLVQGLSPSQSGLWMLPYACTAVIGSLVAPLIAARLRSTPTIVGGLVLVAIGFALFTQATPQAEYGLILGALSGAFVTFGLSPLMVLVTERVLASAPKEKSGSAASMTETAGEMGAALGIASLGALVTTVYRNLVVDTVPAGTPEEAAEAARDSLPGAASASEGLPGETAAELMAAAREAFMTGITVVSYTSVVIVLGLAVAIFLFLQPDGTAKEEGTADPSDPTAPSGDDSAGMEPTAPSGDDSAGMEPTASVAAEAPQDGGKTESGAATPTP